MSVGDLAEEDIEGIRAGEIADPSVSKVAALADETAGAILRESARLPEREIVLGIVRQFRGQRDSSTP